MGVVVCVKCVCVWGVYINSLLNNDDQNQTSYEMQFKMYVEGCKECIQQDIPSENHLPMPQSVSVFLFPDRGLAEFRGCLRLALVSSYQVAMNKARVYCTYEI